MNQNLKSTFINSETPEIPAVQFMFQSPFVLSPSSEAVVGESAFLAEGALVETVVVKSSLKKSNEIKCCKKFS